MSSIPLSPKHGLNPSVTVCFWCGEGTGVALLGRIKNDQEAPRQICTDYNPCDACKENFSKGIHVVEVSQSPCHEGQPELQKGFWPTGAFVVVSEDYIKRLFGDPEPVLKHRKALMDKETFQDLFGNTSKAPEEASQ